MDSQRDSLLSTCMPQLVMILSIISYYSMLFNAETCLPYIQTHDGEIVQFKRILFLDSKLFDVDKVAVSFTS